MLKDLTRRVEKLDKRAEKKQTKAWRKTALMPTDEVIARARIVWAQDALKLLLFHKQTRAQARNLVFWREELDRLAEVERQIGPLN